MRSTPAAITLCILLASCTGEAEQEKPVTDVPEQPPASRATAEVADQWAADLINGAEAWEAVTAEAVPAHRINFALCRLPIPGVDDHGPHDAYAIEDLFDEDPDAIPEVIADATPTSPANQYIVNPVGREHFYSDKQARDPAASQPLPVGTVIIKEKYQRIEDANKRTNPHSFGVMIKQEPGYDPEHGDWEYAYIELGNENKITSATRGKIASCIDCHANRKQTDYVFRGYPLMNAPD